jgi:hypothetical protein
MKFTIEIEFGNDGTGIADYHDLGSKLCSLGEYMKELYEADLKPSVTDGDVMRDDDGETIGAWSILDPRHTITPNDINLPPFEVNDAQYKAIRRKHERNPDGAADFAEFQSRARWGYGGVIMLHWCGMWLGIEPDGYTHS